MRVFSNLLPAGTCAARA